MTASSSNKTAAESLRNGLETLQKMEEMSSPDASSTDDSPEDSSFQDEGSPSTSDEGSSTRSMFEFVQ